MAALLDQHSSSISIFGLVAVCFLLQRCYCSESNWSPAGATWYGSPSGAGTDGGACGYGDAVGKAPFSSMVSAGGPSLFQSGKGCGACYQVSCNSNQACSRNPVTVVITDECPGGICASDPVHFDLSGTAFGALAIPGKADQLRNAGQLQIQHRRVPCHFPGTTLVFHVDAGSNPFYFATVVEFENGDGTLFSVQLQESSNPSVWRLMERSWGALWKLNSGSELRGPLSLQLKLDSGKTVVATNVIPAGWQAGATYRSHVNF